MPSFFSLTLKAKLLPRSSVEKVRPSNGEATAVPSALGAPFLTSMEPWPSLAWASSFVASMVKVKSPARRSRPESVFLMSRPPVAP